MELQVGIEPTTCALQVRCSTIEPLKHEQEFLLLSVSSPSKRSPRCEDQIELLNSFYFRETIQFNKTRKLRGTSVPLLIIAA